MDITYDYYRVFYYVARYGSFSRAAEALLKGQPNITKTINNLESQLGCKSFIRSNKGIALTPEGEKLYKHAEIAFENLSKAELEIVSESNLDGGLVTVAATEISLYGTLLNSLSAFSTEYPNVRIRLANFTTPQAIESLKNGLADFAVVTLNYKIDDTFKVHKITDYRVILCCKKGYLKDTDKDIFSYPYISTNRNSHTYRFLQEHLHSLSIYKEPDIEVATADQILPIVKSGMGIGFVSEYLAEPAIANGEIEEISLDNPPERINICLVEDKKRTLSIAAKTLKKFLKIG